MKVRGVMKRPLGVFSLMARHGIWMRVPHSEDLIIEDSGPRRYISELAIGDSLEALVGW